MKKFLLLLTLLPLFSAAQDSSWTKGGMGGLTFSQVGLFNWAAGGQSNMTLIGNVNLFANYKKGTTTWDNSLDLAYGFIKNNFIYAPELPITKAEDKIDLNSKFGKKAWSDKLYYAALLNFRSQFAPGYSVPGAPIDSYTSKFMAPGYLQFSIGLDYKPTQNLSIFFGPLAGKMTMVMDDSLAGAGAFGVNQRDAAGDFRPGSFENMRIEFGANLRMKYKRDIMENVGFETQLDLFSNYIDRPQNVDVRWTTAWVLKVNKLISVTLNTDLIYDHDIALPKLDSKGVQLLHADGTPRFAPNVQFKEVFGVTFSYKFQDPKPAAK